MSIAEDIAEEYLPDRMVNGQDCPDISTAEEIVDKVLDTFYELIAPIQANTKESMQVKDKVLDAMYQLRHNA